MQLHLTFKSTAFSLPLAYRNIVQGMIYHALKEDSGYSDFVHERGNMTDGRKFKGFTFSPLKGTYSIIEKRICFTEETSLEIRSVDERFIELLAKALQVGEYTLLGSNKVEIIQSRVTDYHLLIPEVSIRLISPMAAYITEPNGKTRYYSPKDEEYLHAVTQNTRRKCDSFMGMKGADFHIEPIWKSMPRKEVTSFKHTYITAWYGEYHLTGEPKVIDLLYQVGLGAKSSQGFGMFSPR